MVAALLCFVLLLTCEGQSITDLNQSLMRSTFKFDGKGSIGTVFVMGTPSKDNPSVLRYTLITAAHVLEAANGDEETLNLRVKNGDQFVRRPFIIKIRDHGTNLWVRHPSADVAALRISVPEEIAWMASCASVPVAVMRNIPSASPVRQRMVRILLALTARPQPSSKMWDVVGLHPMAPNPDQVYFVAMTKKHKQHIHLPQNGDGEAASGQPKVSPTHIANKVVKAMPSHDEVARKAYAIYQAESCPQGRDTQHWLQAEAQLLI